MSIEAIRLSSEPSERRVHKYVDVKVAISPEDVANTLTRDEVVRLCGRHNIRLKSNGRRGGRNTKISAEEVDVIADRLRLGDIEGALIGLERVLPIEFSNLSNVVARFYRGRS